MYIRISTINHCKEFNIANDAIPFLKHDFIETFYKDRYFGIYPNLF